MDLFKQQAFSLNDAGVAAYNKGEYEKSVELFSQSLGITQEIFPMDSQEVGRVYKNLGLAYLKTKNYTEAVKIFGKAVGIYNAIYKTDVNLESAKLLLDMGDCLYYLGQDESAIQVYQKAAQIGFRLEGDRSEIGLKAKTYEGRSLYYSAKYDDAIKLLNDISERSLEALGRDSNVTLTAFNMLGRTWEKVAEKLKSKVSHDRYKDFIMCAASGFANGGDEPKAKRLIDLYNNL